MEKHRGFTVGDPHARGTMLWLHGYTGAPDAFLDIAEEIAHATGLEIHAPLLPGHGTREENLLDYTYDDFVQAARHHAAEIYTPGRPFYVLGYSFGGYLAAHIAAKYAADAAIFALTPFTLRFPFSLPHVEKLLRAQTFWDKRLTQEDLRMREGTFYYPHAPYTSLPLIKEGNRRIVPILRNISCPILTLHNADDPLVSPRSGADMLAAAPRAHGSSAHVLPDGRHALFFRPEHSQEERLVLEFIQKNTPPSS